MATLSDQRAAEIGRQSASGFAAAMVSFEPNRECNRSLLLVVVFFPPMAHRKNRHRAIVVDLERRYIPEAPSGMISSHGNGIDRCAFRQASSDDCSVAPQR